MSGLLALHGGGEFLPGDEPFLAAILRAAPAPRRAVVVPTAAARGRPDLAAANGVEALRRVAAAEGLTTSVAVARVVDAASAADPTLVDALAGADLVHFPGGDPDLIPTILSGTPAWAAIEQAWRDGAVLAGASAGAMAFAERTWTPAGPIDGLGLVPGLAVIPHADAGSWARNLQRFGSLVPAGLGLLGLAERTGVVGRPGEPWTVVGEGEVRWLAAGATSALVVRPGETIRLETGG